MISCLNNCLNNCLIIHIQCIIIPCTLVILIKFIQTYKTFDPIAHMYSIDSTLLCSFNFCLFDCFSAVLLVFSWSRIFLISIKIKTFKYFVLLFYNCFFLLLFFSLSHVFIKQILNCLLIIYIKYSWTKNQLIIDSDTYIYLVTCGRKVSLSW